MRDEYLSEANERMIEDGGERGTARGVQSLPAATREDQHSSTRLPNAISLSVHYRPILLGLWKKAQCFIYTPRQLGSHWLSRRPSWRCSAGRELPGGSRSRIGQRTSTTLLSLAVFPRSSLRRKISRLAHALYHTYIRVDQKHGCYGVHVITITVSVCSAQSLTALERTLDPFSPVSYTQQQQQQQQHTFTVAHTMVQYILQ